MKPILKLLFLLKILFLIFVVTLGLTACNKNEINEIQERHYMGIWKIAQYSIDGHEDTFGYIGSHRDYAVYVKPGHTFSETWTDPDGVQNITGTWDLSENGKSIFLMDSRYGERKCDLNYIYTLKLKISKEEWILRKI